MVTLKANNIDKTGNVEQDSLTWRSQLTNQPDSLAFAIRKPLGLIPTNNLFGHWKFDEGGGTVLKDETSNNRDGTINGAEYVEGVTGKALKFDSSDYVSLPDSGSLPTGALDVTVWVKMSNHKSSNRIVWHDWSAAGDWIVYADDTNWVFGIRDSGNTQQLLTIAHNDDTSEWHHLRATYDGSTQRFFVDGEEASSTNDFSVTLNNGGTFRISHDSFDTLNGLVDELRIYTSTISEDAAEAILRDPLPELNDVVNFSVDGSTVFAGKVVSFEDSIEAAKLKTRMIECKDWRTEFDDHLYTNSFEEVPLYNVLRDILHTVNTDLEKRIAQFESGESWSGASDDTTNFREGSQSKKITSNGSYVTSNFNPSSALDLSNASQVAFDYFVDTVENLDKVRVRLGDNGLSNYFELEITSGHSEEWNHVHEPQSNFTQSGSPDWSNIAEIEIACDATGSDTVNVSFDDMFATQDDAFTMHGVQQVENRDVESLSFGFKPPTEVMKRLAEVFAYDWYVDPDRDIQFFASKSQSAPFVLDDTSGNHDFNTLRLKEDINQIRNKVRFFGGEAVSDNTFSQDLSYQTNGTNKLFQLEHKYDADSLVVKLNSSEQGIGIDGEDSLSDGDVDVLFNAEEKTLEFNSALAGGDTLTTEGKRLFPLAAVFADSASIQEFGVKEFVLKEEDITTFDGAIQRGLAEFERYANEQITGEFETDTSGLRAGQRININSDTLGINRWYVIQSVEARMRTESSLRYRVRLVSTRVYSMVDILQNLLAQQRKELDDYDSDELLTGVFDVVEVEDIVTVSTGKKVTDEVEASDTTDTFLETGGDPFTYVVGPANPSSNTDKTRTPCADGGATFA